MPIATGDARSVVRCGTSHVPKRIATAPLTGADRSGSKRLRGHVNRKRKLRHRERVRALLIAMFERRRVARSTTRGRDDDEARVGGCLPCVQDRIVAFE